MSTSDYLTELSDGGDFVEALDNAIDQPVDVLLFEIGLLPEEITTPIGGLWHDLIVRMHERIHGGDTVKSPRRAANPKPNYKPPRDGLRYRCTYDRLVIRRRYRRLYDRLVIQRRKRPMPHM